MRSRPGTEELGPAPALNLSERAEGGQAAPTSCPLPALRELVPAAPCFPHDLVKDRGLLTPRAVFKSPHESEVELSFFLPGWEFWLRWLRAGAGGLSAAFQRGLGKWALLEAAPLVCPAPPTAWRPPPSTPPGHLPAGAPPHGPCCCVSGSPPLSRCGLPRPSDQL